MVKIQWTAKGEKRELVFELGIWGAAAEGVGRKNSVLPKNLLPILVVRNCKSSS